MLVPYSRRALLVLPLVLCAGLSGCGSFDAGTRRIAEVVTPYKLEVVQGNFVSAEQVQLLKAGLTRAQVKELLGTPLVTSVFRQDRWDYSFNLHRQDVPAQTRKLTLYFKGDVLERFEGDPMPTEAEFVSSLDAGRKDIKPPPLEATPEALNAVALPRTPSAVQAAPAPLPLSYPPLEPAAP